MTTLRSTLEQKASVSEFEVLRKSIEKISKDVEFKANFKDFDAHVSFTKNVVEDISKEVILKANIKDLIPLLDTKANVEDVNSTLSLV